MKCGSCKGNHQSVADVKECYGQAAEDEANAKSEAAMEKRAEQFWEERGGAEDDPREREAWAREDETLFAAQEQQRDAELDAASKMDAMVGKPKVDAPSDKQVSYALALLRDRMWPDELDEADLRAMERRQVSKLINSLVSAPKKDISIKVTKQAVDPGRYAIEHDDVVRFYQVDRPETGRWAGMVFVKQLFGAPGNFRQERVRGGNANEIIRTIARDPQHHSLLFGKTVGQCGVCSSPLTNDESRMLGIGPVCRAKKGW